MTTTTPATPTNTPVLTGHTSNDVPPPIYVQSSDMECGTIGDVSYAWCIRQGKRPTMEDMVHFTELCKGERPSWSIFDGHSGTEAAKFACQKVHEFIGDALNQNNITAVALTKAYEQTDKDFHETYPDNGSGTTAITVVLDAKSKTFSVGHVGDTRVVACRDGKAVQLTKDHNSRHDGEKKRVLDAKGFFVRERLCGDLMVTRAIGDNDLKRHCPGVLIATPDVMEGKIDDYEFIVMVSDGMFEYGAMTNETVVECVRKGIAAGQYLLDIARGIVERAIRNGSRDNVSAIIIRFR